MINWKKKNQEEVLEEKEAYGVPYLTFSLLNLLPMVKHAFSTRLGGVSRGEFASMNFITARGDTQEAVNANYEIMSKVLETPREQMVAAYQMHTTNVRKVGQEDAGKGIVYPRDYRDVDGLITNVPGLMLVTFYADCIPLYLVDVKNKAIGLSHAGWRGTVNNMAKNTIKAMQEAYDTKPENLFVAIGPGICSDCYEVNEELADEFKKIFPDNYQRIVQYNSKGNYFLDLCEANAQQFLDLAVPKSQIALSNICTCCNAKYLFSHRASAGKRGNMAAFLSLTI
ncbi:laccase domain protein [Clostridia bacterium]|nr:laccase domain protein [Clostridia bacterium]